MPGTVHPLEPDTVDIVYMLTDAIDAMPTDRLEAVLNEDERTRAERFRFAPLRRHFIIAHALVQYSLRLRTGRPRCSFREGPNGKPELDPPFGAPVLRYNLSHTRGMVVVALAWGHDIGIDVERVDRETPCADLARRFFAPEEAEAICDPVNGGATRFFATWTVKEAVLKAVGIGLGAPLDSFTVELDPLALSFGTDALPSAGWHLRQRRFPDHFLSVALHAPSARYEPTMRFKEMTCAQLLAGLDELAIPVRPSLSRAAQW